MKQDSKIYKDVEHMNRMLTVIMRKLEIAEEERKALKDSYNALSTRLIEMDCDRIIAEMQEKPKRKRGKKDETES